MNAVLLTLGDFTVTYAIAALAGAAAIAVLLLALFVGAMRSNARHIAVLSQQSAEQLKAALTAQIAERDGRIMALDHQVALERKRGADLLEAERNKSAQLLARWRPCVLAWPNRPGSPKPTLPAFSTLASR